MATDTLDRLLTTLDVRLHAFAVCEIEAGWRLVIDAMEAITVHYVLAGSGTVRTENGSEAPFEKHSIIVVPAGQNQSLGAPRGAVVGESLAVEHCAMLADGLVRFTAGNGRDGVTCVCGTISATYSGSLGLFDRLDRPIVEDAASIQPLRHALELMFAELAMPGVGTRALTEALMKQCLIVLLRQHLVREGDASPLFVALQDRRLARAVAAIVERPADIHTVESLAEIAGMSRSAFAERFAFVLGRSPIEFVQTVRLRLAAQLLSTTDLPVKVVANSIGYASRSHFSRAFKGAYDLDPKTFRAMSFTPPPEERWAGAGGISGA